MIEDEEIEYTLNTLEEQPDEQIGTIEEQPEEQISTISEDIYTIGVESLNGQAGHLTLKNINGTDLVGAGDITLATPSDVQAEATAREEADIQLQNAVNTKQDALTAGANIQINGSVISATDTTYTAGDNIQINGTTISATDTTYSAGEGLNLNDTTFSVDTTTIATQGDVSNLQEQINGKQDQLSETQLNAVNSGIDSTKVEQIATNKTDIDTIEGKIPNQASTSNQLADKAFVNSSVQTATANFRGNWEDWASVPSNAEDYPADYAGSKTPTVNDYLVVQDASDYTGDTLEGTWRFKYSGTWATNGKNGWLPEYQVNETPLTAAQLAAINSGITDTLVTQIGTNATNIASLQTSKQDKLTSTQLAAVNSGIDSTKVAQIATNTNDISALQTGKQNKLTAGDGITIASDTISVNDPAPSGYWTDGATTTGTGSVITLDNTLDAKLADIKGYGDTIQASDPTPDSPQAVNVVTGEQTVSVAGQTYPLSLGSMELCKIGTYQDYIYKSGDKWYKHQEIAKEILDENSNWTDQTTYYRSTVVSDSVAGRAVCDYYKYGGDSTPKSFWNTTGSFRTNDLRASLADYKTWISTHNITLYYAKNASNSTEVEITDTTLIAQLNALASAQSVEGQTIITVTSVSPNLPLILEAKVYQDTHAGLEGAIATKQDELTAGTNINIDSNVVSTQTRGVEYIVGTQTAATNVWTGVSTDKGCSNSTLYVGKTIVYYLPQAGNSSAATLTLTLPDGTTTSAIELRRAGTSTVTTTYAAGNAIFMTYDGTYWKTSAYYDSNSNTVSQLRAQNAFKAVTAITANTLCCGTSAGYIQLGAGSTFDITYPLLWQTAATTAGTTSTTFYYAIEARTVRNNKASWTGTTNQMVWLVGTLSGNTFTVGTDVFTQTIPTTEDGKVYAPIGIAYSTYQIYFKSPEQFWWFKSGEFRPVAQSEVAPAGFWSDPATITSTGTNLTLNNQLPVAIKDVQLKGDTEQISYTGKNLFNYNAQTYPYTDGGVTATLADDGTISVSGILSRNYVVIVPLTEITDKLENGATYTVSASINTPNVFLDISAEDTSQVAHTIARTRTVASDSFTVDKTTYPKYYAKFQTYNTTTWGSSSITVAGKFQLEKGTATVFEPFVGGIPSPNPDYPQAVNTVTGRQVVGIGGKNLAWSGWASDFVSRVNRSDRAELVTEDGKSCVHYEMRAGYQEYDTKYFYKPLGGFKENTQYTFSFDIKSTTQFTNLVALYTDGTSTNFGSELTADTWTHLTLTTSAGKTVKYIRVNYNSGWDYIDLDTFQVEEGTAATPYEPAATTYEVNLGKNLVNTVETHSSINSSGNISVNPTSTNYLGIEDYVACRPNTTYTVTFEHDNAAASIYVGFRRADGSFIERNGYTTLRTFTTPDEACSMFFYLNKSGIEWPTVGGYVQVEYGAVATSYSAYFTPIELCKIGTYQDYIWKDGADWKVHKETQKKVLDGSESWSLFSTAASELRYSFSTSLSGKKFSSDVTNVACDTFKVLNSSGSTAGDAEKYTCRGTTYNTVFYLMTPRTTISGETSEEIVANFKVWLASHVTTVYYQLATATDTAITDATLISQLEALASAQMKAGQTNIISSGTPPNLDAILTIETFQNNWNGLSNYILEANS